MESYTVKVLFLGDEGCGKSTFLSKLSQGRQSLSKPTPVNLLRDEDQPFVYELRNRKYEYRIETYDTSSPEHWRLLHPDVVVICYDISQRLSLINLQRTWLPQIKTTFSHSDTLPMLILGLKRDLRSETDPNGIIYPNEAHRIAAEMRADRYMECSAATGELVFEVWEDICATAVKTATGGGGEGAGQSEGGCIVM